MLTPEPDTVSQSVDSGDQEQCCSMLSVHVFWQRVHVSWQRGQTPSMSQLRQLLALEEKRELHQRAKQNAAEQVETRARQDSTNAVAKLYDVDALWGVSDARWPLQPDIAERIAAEKLQVSKVGGLTQYGGIFRTCLRQQTVVHDQNAIPPGNIKRHASCAALHKGLCKTRDAGIIADVLPALQKLREWIVQTVAEGDMFRIGVTGTDGAVDVSHWLVAHIRHGDPKLVVVVGFNSGSTINDLSMALGGNGKIRIAMLSEVVRKFWDKPVHKIHVSSLTVQSSMVAFDKVAVTAVGALHEITWRGVAVPVAAPAATGELMDEPLPSSLVRLGHRLEAGFSVQQGDALGAGRTACRRGCVAAASGSEGSSSDSDTDMVIDQASRLAAEKVAKRKRGDSEAAARAMAAAGDDNGAVEGVSADEHAEPKGKVARGKGPRQSRQVWWHGWQLAPLSVGGWGAMCKCHINSWDSEGTVCKKQVTSGTGPQALSDQECRVRVKQWLLEGLRIDSSRPDARDRHVFGVKPRELPLMSESEVDELAASAGRISSSTGAASSSQTTGGPAGKQTCISHVHRHQCTSTIGHQRQCSH